MKVICIWWRLVQSDYNTYICSRIFHIEQYIIVNLEHDRRYSSTMLFIENWLRKCYALASNYVYP